MIKLTNFIDNEFINSDLNFINFFDPGKGEIIGKMPVSDKNVVKTAVESSLRAFEKWRNIPFSKRLKLVWNLKNFIEREEERLAIDIAINVGKTLKEAKGEILRAKENIESAISFIKNYGIKMRDLYTDIDAEIYREAMGTFVIITPFNFPFMIPFWFLPYALILGNTVIIKPSELTPLCHRIIAEMSQKILPKGVINIVYGEKEVVKNLLSHKDVVGTTFVGSTPVAKIVYDTACKYRKRVIAQGGAKNRIVVMPDANIKKSIPTIINSFFGMAGQRCLAGTILITLNKNYNSVKNAFIKATSNIQVGYMLNKNVDMGPVVSSISKNRIINYINKSDEQGAKIVVDGRNIKVKGYENGFFIGPTIIEDVEKNMDIYKDEIFGPVACLMRVDNFDDAIQIVNDSNYGNAASIFTSNGKFAKEFVKKAVIGNIGINIGVAQPPPYTPFAGKKDSFFGILHGQTDTIDFFTDRKIIIERWF